MISYTGPLPKMPRIRRERKMNKRNEEEIEAYIDGYNACFEQFMECLRGRKNLMDALAKMRRFKEAVNSVILAERKEGQSNE